jgi:hypothetical protein
MLTRQSTTVFAVLLLALLGQAGTSDAGRQRGTRVRPLRRDHPARRASVRRAGSDRSTGGGLLGHQAKVQRLRTILASLPEPPGSARVEDLRIVEGGRDFATTHRYVPEPANGHHTPYMAGWGALPDGRGSGIHMSSVPSKKPGWLESLDGAWYILDLRGEPGLHEQEKARIAEVNAGRAPEDRLDSGSVPILDGRPGTIRDGLRAVALVMRARMRGMSVDFHCNAGHGRTHFVNAFLRIVLLGWSTQDALAEARLNGSNQKQLEVIEDFGNRWHAGELTDDELAEFHDILSDV